MSNADVEANELLEKVLAHDWEKPVFKQADKLVWEFAGEFASCRICADTNHPFVCNRQSTILMRWHEDAHEKMDARFDMLMRER